MRTSVLLFTPFIPFLAHALPTVTSASALLARDDASCTPTSYTISSYTYTYSSSSGTTSNPSVHFTFTSTFPDTAASSTTVAIDDPASIGTSCVAHADTTASFPNESSCASGRGNVIWDLRGSVEEGALQIIHQWSCDGKSYLSSTPVQIDAPSCSTTTEGSVDTVTCSSDTQSFAPQNVRAICGAPTCP